MKTQEVIVQGRTLQVARCTPEALKASGAVTVPWTGLLEITKELSEYLLTLNTHNRRVSQDRVDRYMARMAANVWYPDIATPILVSTEGVLLNGQHRLLAVKECGLPIVMNMGFGAPPDALAHIDTGLIRTVGQNVGLLHVANAQRITACVNMMHGILTRRERSGLQADDIVRFVRENPETVKWSEEWINKDILKTAIVFGPLMFAYPTNPVLITKFAEQLVLGENLSAGMPALTLRNVLFTGSFRHDKARQEAGRRSLSAIYAFLKKRPLMRMGINNEAIGYFLRKYPEGSIVQSWVPDGPVTEDPSTLKERKKMAAARLDDVLSVEKKE